MEQFQALAVRDVAHELPLDKLGGFLSGSGFFKDTKSAAQAIVKVIAGREMGLGPISAMTGIHVIEGKVTVGAGLLASCVKRSGRYNYRVKSLTETDCLIEFYENGQSVGVSGFMLKDAAAAGIGGKPVWKQYPKNMLFARAMSNGVRWYCPDVFGTAVYTPEELGADVNEEGEVIEGSVVEVPAQPQPEPKHEAKAQPLPHMNGNGFNPVAILVEGGIAENGHEAARILNKYVPKGVKADKDQLLAWGKLYRAWRDLGSDPLAAASNATQGVPTE